MKRLDFRMPDFTRHAWASDRAREVWAPRIARVGAAFAEIEWRAVAARVRPCALRVVDGAALGAVTDQMAEAGLAVVELDRLALSNAPYQSGAAPVLPGQRFAQRVVVGSEEDATLLRDAWRRGAQEEVGRLLGYPACCSRFFQRVWADERFTDTTWPMAMGTALAQRPDRGDALPEGTDLEVAGPAQANILLRWLGVRAVPHLPCRLDCEGTVALADRLLDLMRRRDLGAEADWLLEMLAWPVEWSALHGIAEIKTPIVKIAASTDATAARYRVRRPGSGYPAEGARGLSFPYLQPGRLRLLGSASFRRGLENPIAEAEAKAASLAPADPRAAWFGRHGELFSQNGYPASPRRIYEAFLEVVDRPGPILELGCGNGLLLRFLHDHSRHVLECSGVDVNAAAIRAAQAVVFPDRPQAFSVGDARSCALRSGYNSLILASPIYADAGYYDQRDGRIQRLQGDGSIARYIERCVEALADGGRLILFCYAEQLRQIAPFRAAFDREVGARAPRVVTSEAGDVTFFLIEPRTGERAARGSAVLCQP